MPATGSDSINLELLKHGGSIVDVEILHSLNEGWKQKNVPDEWKTAEMISLFKKGNRGPMQ